MECPLTDFTDCFVKPWEMQINDEIHDIPKSLLDPLAVKARAMYVQGCIDEDNQKQKKECTMRATIDTTRDSSLDYLRDRIQVIYWMKHEEIQEQFRDAKPKTFKEAREWIKNGEYRFDLPEGIDEAKYPVSYFHSYFKWGKKAPDYAKRDQLVTKLSDVRDDAIDTVTVVSDEKIRLETLKKFEAYKVN